jgi:hypothetical protein
MKIFDKTGKEIKKNKFLFSIEMFFYNIKMFYYDLRFKIKNLIKYTPHVIHLSTFDYISIYLLLKMQLEFLHDTIKKSYIIEEEKKIRLYELSRCIYLLNRLINDDYINETDFKNSNCDIEFHEINDTRKLYELKFTNVTYTNEQYKEYCAIANKNKEKDKKELFSLLNDKIEFWWA